MRKMGGFVNDIPGMDCLKLHLKIFSGAIKATKTVCYATLRTFYLNDSLERHVSDKKGVLKNMQLSNGQYQKLHM